MILVSLISLLVLLAVMFCQTHQNFQLVSADHQKDCRIWKYDIGGIPYYRYRGYPEGQNNPSYVANEVIAHYNESIHGDAAALAKLTNNADWLVKHAVSHGNYSILDYEFPFAYEMEPPWRSTLAQGKALGALAKAFEVTNNLTYLNTAKSLLNSFFIEVRDGGVALKTTRDGWWFEQHARNNVDNASRVLNGMIRTLLDIYAYYDYTHDISAKFLFDQGVRALKNALPLYDNNGWSYYDIHKKPAKPPYHLMHIRLLDALFDITGEEIFGHFRDKWQAYMIASNITPPEVIDVNISDSVVSPNLSAIVIKFSEPLARSSINASTVKLMQSNSTEFCTRSDAVDGKVLVKPDRSTVVFKLKEALEQNSSYRLIITQAVKDLAGNAMLMPDTASLSTGPEPKRFLH